MNYLEPSEYETYGLEATTLPSWITAASAMIDAHCRRTTLGVVQYQERLRIPAGRNTVRVSYVPLASADQSAGPIVSARGRYVIPRNGEWPFGDLSSDVATAFGLPGTWTTIDAASIDVYAETGELTLPINAIGLGFSEVEVAYTAGLTDVPDGVKVACAQIVKNAQANPGLNVSATTIDHLRMEYFSDSLIDPSIRELLAPYVAQKVG